MTVTLQKCKTFSPKTFHVKTRFLSFGEPLHYIFSKAVHVVLGYFLRTGILGGADRKPLRNSFQNFESTRMLFQFVSEEMKFETCLIKLINHHSLDSFFLRVILSIEYIRWRWSFKMSFKNEIFWNKLKWFLVWWNKIFTRTLNFKTSLQFL